LTLRLLPISRHRGLGVVAGLSVGVGEDENGRDEA